MGVLAMDTLKNKMIAAILCCTVLAAVLVGLVSLYTTNNILQEKADAELQLHCLNTAQQMDETLDNISRATEIIYDWEKDRGQDRSFFANPDNVQKNIQRMHDVIMTQAVHTPGCLAAYMRYNPKYTAQGVFVVRGRDGVFQDNELTDIESYDASDTEHVGWYYAALQAGHAIWLKPYYNKNIDTYMVSYVIPIYEYGEPVGVVGMDIDFAYIESMIRNISLYSTGYAFLMDGNEVIVHRDVPIYTQLKDFSTKGTLELRQVMEAAGISKNLVGTYSYDGVLKKFASTKLHNDMEFFLCVPQAEIYADARLLMLKLAATILATIAVVTFLANLLMNWLLRRMNRDVLTNLPNRGRFLRLFASLQLKDTDYVMFLLDIDKFKSVNDLFGHSSGDHALCQIADDLRAAAGSEWVCRWGGDEFIGILPKEGAGRRLEQLRQAVEKRAAADYGRITISIGVCPIHKDWSFEQMFECVDAALYQAKQAGRNQIAGVRE